MYNYQSKEIIYKELFIYKALDICENDYEFLKEELENNYDITDEDLKELYNIIDRIKKNRSVISVRRSNKLFHAVNNIHSYRDIENVLKIHEIITSLIEKGEI